MCGIAGYHGVSEEYMRQMLAWSLGSMIDLRGGHAAGFLSITSDGTPLHGRKLGTFADANDRFYRRIARGPIAMLHARFATCGRGGVGEAHPFEIRRGGRPVLWGAHNGVLRGTDETAKAYGRKHDVDSRELFELLADDKMKEINGLTGYGVVQWVEANSPDAVYLCRLSDDSDLRVVKLSDGSVVWASTLYAIEDAVKIAGLEIENEIDCGITGMVYRVADGWVTKTRRKDFTVSKRIAYAGSYGSYLKGEDGIWRIGDTASKEKDDEQALAEYFFSKSGRRWNDLSDSDRWPTGVSGLDGRID
jgi:predicted glutamine amidotransferase